jgi:hypothetical protein
MTAPKTWRSWSCGTSCGCCAARAAVPSSPQATGSCSRLRAGCSPDSGGHRFSSRRRRCCAGTAPGPTQVDLRQAAHTWPATDRPADRRPRPSDGQGERPVGLRADLRGASQARHLGGCHHRKDAAATTRPGSGATALGPTWGQFLRAQAEGVVACDLFTVETIRRKTLHVLFFVQLSTRRVVAAGVTAHPGTAWVTQQARNAAMDLNDRGVAVRFLLRDHDAKFTGSFDEVFGSAGGQVLRTPIRRRRRMPMPSGGSRRCGWSVWTGRWCSGGATWCGCCAATSATTTSSDRTAAWR